MKLGVLHTASPAKPLFKAGPSTQNANPAWMNWLTMFLLIGNTANPFFYESIEMLAISFIVLLGCWFLKKEEDTRLNSLFWIYLVVLTALPPSQTLVYHVFPIKPFLGEYLRILFAVMAIRIIGPPFFDQFVRFV